MFPDDPSQDRKYRAPALEKGLDVLELLASHGAAMTPSQISIALGRSLSELFRMIQVLEFKGYISPASPGDGYELTNKLFTLGMARAPVKTLLEAALPVMRDLASTINQSCHLAMPSEDQVVIVARVESPGYYGYSVRTGHRRKIKLNGRWLLPMLRLLKHGKVLRDTPLDPFGWQADRRLERRMIREYEADIDLIVAHLTVHNLGSATGLAALPQQIRGFGHIKAASYEKARARHAALRQELEAIIQPRKQAVTQTS